LWDCIHRAHFFDIAHAFNTSLPGWIVIVARRHVETIADLSEDEGLELGNLIRSVSKHLQEITGCVKTYVMQFAEAPGHNHVHFHIVPRMNDISDSDKGINVFNCLGVAEEDRVSENIMNGLAANLRIRLEAT
jgi:diadenosine tetraphosphate (Ap4A) HIT family hydrolase